MKLINHKNIVLLISLFSIMLLSQLNAAEIKRSTLDNNEDAIKYEFITINNSIKQISKIKQLTVKARALNIDIKGNNTNEIKIITLRKYLSDNKKIKDVEIVKFSEENSLHKDGFTEFANFDISIKDKEILLDFPKLPNDKIQSVELLLPKNISLDLKIREGDMKLSKFKNEVNIKGKQLDIEFENIRSVLDVENKVGFFIMNDFEGVLNLNTLSSDIKLNEINGSINITSSTGSFDLNNFSGNLELTTKVSDIKIMDSRESEIFIDYKSGNLKLEDLKKVDIVDITATIGDIFVERSIIKKLNIVNQGGDVFINDSQAKMNVNLKAGDIIYKSEKLYLADDSYLSIEYGDIVLDVKDGNEYEYYTDRDMKPLSYNDIEKKSSLRNLRIALKGGESNYMNLSVSSGSVIVK